MQIRVELLTTGVSPNPPAGETDCRRDAKQVASEGRTIDAVFYEADCA